MLCRRNLKGVRTQARNNLQGALKGQKSLDGTPIRILKIRKCTFAYSSSLSEHSDPSRVLIAKQSLASPPARWPGGHRCSVRQLPMAHRPIDSKFHGIACLSDPVPTSLIALMHYFFRISFIGHWLLDFANRRERVIFASKGLR
jgi:hypothetical protein